MIFFVFYDCHRVRLGSRSAKILTIAWPGDWQHFRFDPDQSLFMSLCVKNLSVMAITEYVVGALKLGEKLQKKNRTCWTFHQGVVWLPRHRYSL